MPNKKWRMQVATRCWAKLDNLKRPMAPVLLVFSHALVKFRVLLWDFMTYMRATFLAHLITLNLIAIIRLKYAHMTRSLWVRYSLHANGMCNVMLLKCYIHSLQILVIYTAVRL